MDEMRQKLFPIFLKEAERNLQVLRKYLVNERLSDALGGELESAFRAAHTLKGTADLVQALSICKISRRLEAMLEKHFSAGSVPTPVEHEAMQLAVDWLVPLLSALQGNLQEPKLFVTEALQALDLAATFPGRTPLVELIDSRAQQRSPQLDDPFDNDPDLLSDEEELLKAERDPFADDPGFGMEIDLVRRNAENLSQDNTELLVIEDPFAEKLDFVVSDSLAEKSSIAPEVQSLGEDIPFDPFADDDLGLDIAALSVDEVDEVTAPSGPTVVSADPFADDDDFAPHSGVDSFLTPEPLIQEDYATEETDPVESVAEITQTVAERAEGIAESLLLPRQDSEPRTEYVCCVFSIGGRDYYLPIKQMLEIADLPPLLPLPLAPPMVSGLINLRGKVLPVINLSVLNQHQQAEGRVQRRLVIAGYQGESLAFLADGVPHLSENFIGEQIDMRQFLSLHRLRGAQR